MLKITSRNVEDTENTAFALAKTLTACDIVALKGDLGVGKTAFVRGLARGLGYRGEVTSPTYALVHEYRGKINLLHFDMYRVNNMDALYSTGYFDFLDTGSILAIEWSENIEFALPKKKILITLSYGKQEYEREIMIDID